MSSTKQQEQENDRMCSLNILESLRCEKRNHDEKEVGMLKFSAFVQLDLIFSKASFSLNLVYCCVYMKEEKSLLLRIACTQSLHELRQNYN